MELADRYNTALVCHRWNYLACHPRLWLRVDQSVKDLSEPLVFPDLKTAVSVARFVMLWTACMWFLGYTRTIKPDLHIVPHRPGDTILIAAGGSHPVSNIQIKKQLCLVCCLFYKTLFHICVWIQTTVPDLIWSLFNRSLFSIIHPCEQLKDYSHSVM